MTTDSELSRKFDEFHWTASSIVDDERYGVVNACNEIIIGIGPKLTKEQASKIVDAHNAALEQRNRELAELRIVDFAKAQVIKQQDAELADLKAQLAGAREGVIDECVEALSDGVAEYGQETVKRLVLLEAQEAIRALKENGHV